MGSSLTVPRRCVMIMSRIKCGFVRFPVCRNVAVVTILCNPASVSGSPPNLDVKR